MKLMILALHMTNIHVALLTHHVKAAPLLGRVADTADSEDKSLFKISLLTAICHKTEILNRL